MLAIDQLHRLLRMVGWRRLDIEVRHFGATSLQVVRRLRALLENVRESLPKERSAPLTAQLQLLDAAVKRSFPGAKDRALAAAADYHGLGSDDERAALMPTEPAGTEEGK